MGPEIDDRSKLSGRVNAAIDAVLAPGEQIRLTIAFTNSQGAAASDTRFFIVKKDRVATWALHEIRSVEWGTGFIKWLWLHSDADADAAPPKLANILDHPSAMQVAKIVEEERSALDALLARARTHQPAQPPADPTAATTRSPTRPAAAGRPGPIARRVKKVPKARAGAAMPVPNDPAQHPAVWNAKATALLEYEVNYRGGLPEHPASHAGGIKFLVSQAGFELIPKLGSKNWFSGLRIPLDVVTGFEIAQRQVSTFEGILGGLDSRQLNQANNIHITHWRDGIELVLRLEMLSGTFVMAQAGKCRALLDQLRGYGILAQIDQNRARVAAVSARAQAAPAAPAPPPAEDIPNQIRELAKLRDEGILTPEEFDGKKADLLSRM